MWILEYITDHFTRIIKNTYNSLRKKLGLPIIMTVVPMIIAGFIDNTYPVKILITILSGFAGLVSYCFLVFLFHLFKTPIDIYTEDKEAIKLLEAQQQPKLEIRFDESDPRYAHDTCKWSENAQTGERTCIEASHKYRISIHNLSETTIEDIEVKLDKINLVVYPSGRKDPMCESTLPVHFKYTNDKEPYETTCEIHPNDDKTVDVVACFMKSAQVKNNHFVFQHIEDVYPYLQFDIDTDSYEIIIKVTGRNVTCRPRKFMIGLKPEYGQLLMWPVD